MSFVNVIHAVAGVQVKEGGHGRSYVGHVIGHIALSYVVEQLVFVVVSVSEKLGSNRVRVSAKERKVSVGRGLATIRSVLGPMSGQTALKQMNTWSQGNASPQNMQSNGV